MSLVKIRNSTNDGWITVGGGVEVVQSDSEPTTTYAGMLWLDTDANQDPLAACSVTLSTDYVIGATGSDDKVSFDTATFDLNSDFDTTNFYFVCPIAGVYLVSFTLDLQDVDTAATYYRGGVRGATSGDQFMGRLNPTAWGADFSNHSITGTVLVECSAADQVYVSVRQEGGAVQSEVDQVVSNANFMLVR